jgi:hypothetical protein
MENINQRKSNLLIVAAIAGLVIIGLIRGCQSSAPAISKTIQTKEVKGKFKAVKPNQTPVENHVPEVRKKVYNDEFLQGQIDILIAENKALQQFYNEASDSLKIALYNKAIEIKSFNQKFDDDKLTTEVSGLVRGEIQSLKLDYTIKSQTIELPKQKETFLRVLVGGGIGINKELNQPVWKANAGFQNRKGNIIRGSFQRIGSQDYYLAEYDFSILNWKR